MIFKQKPHNAEPLSKRLTAALVLLAAAFLAVALLAHAWIAPALNAQGSTATTNIAIESRVIRSGVKHFGINLSGQSFYDSGIMLRNLFFRNPGFEGSTWQSVLQCKVVKEDTCADYDEWSYWPANFVKGGTFEFIYGAARGQKGTVTASSVAVSSAITHSGVWVSFSKMAVHPQVGDFYIVRKSMPGDAAAGWWTETKGGGTITTESHDLSPNSPGKQAVYMAAPGPTQEVTVNSGVDTGQGRSFVQMNGVYTLVFRAKGMGGTNVLNISLARLSSRYGVLTYMTRQLQLTPSWQDYKIPITVHENGTFIGPVHLTFNVHASSALLDDVALNETAAADNPTAFRNAVVDRLRELHPGILRYMDNGTNYGSSLEDLIAPPFARRRAGYSETKKDADDISIGLHEFLVLCQAVHTEPWFVIPMGISSQETRDLIEYLSAPATKPYGAKRAALGQSAPWTSVFPVIHLELGNETWNWNSFAGEGVPDPKAYASRVGDIFAVARATPGFEPAKFDLIMDGWFAVPWWNEQELSIKSHADTIDIAPYTFTSFNDASSPEKIYGPMFAEPEMLDSRPAGVVAQDAKLAQAAGVKLAVYEVNLGTMEGKINQAELDATIPSLGAGLSTADHMLLMLRDQGIYNQAVFALPEYNNGFTNKANPSAQEMVKLWGTVVDMGGQSNRVRPSFLSEQLANEAIADKMLATTVSGANPTWDQAESGNGQAKLTGAHFLQSFAFTDGKRCSLVLFNLSRTSALPVTLSGAMAPHNAEVQQSRLTSAHLNDTNEDAQKVSITRTKVPSFNPAQPYSLPPYSMTVLTWQTDSNAQKR